MGISRQRLTDARSRSGLSQTQLADLLGTTQARISDWERGLASPRPVFIPVLAAALGMDALELVGADLDSPELMSLRLAAGLSMPALAVAAGTTVMRYRRLERGELRSEPEAALVERLAVALSVPAVTVRAAVDVARNR